MTTNKKIAAKTDTTDSTLAVSLNEDFRSVVKAYSAKVGKSEAHIARLALHQYLTAQGLTLPEVIEAKKGPKAGANLNPAAAKHGLSNAEFNKCVTHFLTHGGDIKKVSGMDWADYAAKMPAPKPRAAKGEASTTEVASQA